MRSGSSLLIFSFGAIAVKAAPASLPIDTIIAKLNDTGACCAALNYFLPNKVLQPLTPGYAASQVSFWSAQEQSLQPACIVVPTSEDDVQTAVTILNVGNRAGIASCKFAVRGAGHTANAGAANIDGGVTIDMQSMNSVVVASDKKTVTFGPGNRWGNVYSSLDPMDISMVGGRVTPVGTAGLITGGGVSFFSGRYGFVCDNIKSANIVLANSTKLTLSATSYPDLFRAIKGASNNFGIITSFTADTFPQPQFWGGSVSQPVTNKEALFSYLSNFTNSDTFDPYAALITDFTWVSGLPTILHQIAYTDGSASWPPPAFAPLVSLPTLTNTVRKGKLSDFTNEIWAGAVVTEDKNNLLVTLTFENKGATAVDFMKAVWDLANDTVQSLLTVVTLNFILTFQPLPHALYSKGSTRGNGPNVLGFERFGDADLLNLLFTLSWTLPTDNARVYAAMQDLENQIRAKAIEMNVFNEFVYLNYAAGWQDPISSYGAGNVNFLKGVSRKYDPQGLFQKGEPGGFKLGI